jgi:hypothetical protein
MLLVLQKSFLGEFLYSPPFPPQFQRAMTPNTLNVEVLVFVRKKNIVSSVQKKLKVRKVLAAVSELRRRFFSLFFC